MKCEANTKQLFNIIAKKQPISPLYTNVIKRRTAGVREEESIILNNTKQQSVRMSSVRAIGGRFLS